MPNLSSFWWVENPGVPFSTMNAVMPFDPFSGSVFAYTTNVDAMGPFVILDSVASAKPSCFQVTTATP